MKNFPLEQFWMDDKAAIACPQVLIFMNPCNTFKARRTPVPYELNIYFAWRLLLSNHNYENTLPGNSIKKDTCCMISAFKFLIAWVFFISISKLM